MGVFDWVGDIFGAGGSKDAAAKWWEAAQKWDELEVLSPEEQARKAKALFDSGLITPEEYQAVLQDPSLLEKFEGDPRLREAQMRSLDYLTKVGTEGGLTAEDRARMNAISNRAATEARGRREANRMRMQSRGMGGSGMSALQDMISDQGASTAQHLAGTDVAANAERRALDAMTRAGTLGGDIRRQEFTEAEKKAAAADKINEFNVRNRNLAMAGNVEARNKARDRAYGLYDDQFDKRRQKLTGWTAAYTGQAPYLQEAGRQEGDAVSGALGSIGDIVAGKVMSDRDVKEDVASARPDIDEFLAELTPQKWDYTDPKYGSTEGQENYGVMAQDMEKSDIGKQFVSKDEEGVKRIDYGKAQGTMLAIIKDLADRLEELEGKGG